MRLHPPRGSSKIQHFRRIRLGYHSPRPWVSSEAWCVLIQFWWNWLLIQYSLSNRSGSRDLESFHSCTPDRVILPCALYGSMYAVLGKLILEQWTTQEWRSHHRSIPESPCVGYIWRLLFSVLYMVRSAKLPLILSATEFRFSGVSSGLNGPNAPEMLGIQMNSLHVKVSMLLLIVASMSLESYEHHSCLRLNAESC